MRQSVAQIAIRVLCLLGLGLWASLVKKEGHWEKLALLQGVWEHRGVRQTDRQRLLTKTQL